MENVVLKKRWWASIAIGILLIVVFVVLLIVKESVAPNSRATGFLGILALAGVVSLVRGIYQLLTNGALEITDDTVALKTWGKLRAGLLIKDIDASKWSMKTNESSLIDINAGARFLCLKMQGKKGEKEVSLEPYKEVKVIAALSERNCPVIPAGYAGKEGKTPTCCMLFQNDLRYVSEDGLFLISTASERPEQAGYSLKVDDLGEVLTIESITDGAVQDVLLKSGKFLLGDVKMWCAKA